MRMQALKPGWRMVKFGDIAENIAVRVDPVQAETDIYVGLEHLDPETLHLRCWGHPSDVTGQKLAFKKGDAWKWGRWFQNNLTVYYKGDRIPLCQDSQDSMHPVLYIMLWVGALIG